MLDTINPSTRPIWYESAHIPKFPQQVGQIHVDVCIIGGGITGLTAADRLKRAGLKVAVVELSRIGAGETGHTTAHLTEILDIDYRDLVSKFGQANARLATSAAREAISLIEQTALRHQIECEFVRLPGYQFTTNENEIAEIEKEAALAQQIGLNVDVVSNSPLPFAISRALRIQNQAQFHPLRFLAGLGSTIPGEGSYLFEETRMIEVREGAYCQVITDHGAIVCDSVVVAANVPSLNRFFLHTKIAAYRTYAIAVRRDDAHPHLNALFWDIETPYHYLRESVINGRRYLIIGGEDHKTGGKAHPAECFQNLARWAEEKLGPVEIDYRWSGQIIESVDGLPYIGRNSLSDNVYVATGFSGNGLTYGTIAGHMLADMILEIENPWESLYSPTRFKPMASMKSFVSENIDFPSHLIGDRFDTVPNAENAVIREDQGMIVRMGSKKLAAYRDNQGELHLMSPVCPHLGCHVGWNDAEKSWDCPCHGSRFNGRGQLLNGPAVANLMEESVDASLPLTPAPIERGVYPLTDGDPGFPPTIPFFSCPISPKTH